MTAETHFVQSGDGPVLIGAGFAKLDCTCGTRLIEGYDPTRFLALGIQCGHCGTVTTTPGLVEGLRPPRSAIIAAPSTEARETAMTVPSGVTVVAQAEMLRLRALFQPAAPETTYVVSGDLLDRAEATFMEHTGSASSDTSPLGGAVRHLRERLKAGSWNCQENALTAAAVTQITGFLHFLATWSGHPLFPVMVATAGDRGFSPHGLAPFAAAHSLMAMGNQIRFDEPLGYPERITGFGIVATPEPVGVHVEVFDRFEFPFGRPFEAASLRTAVAEVLGSAQARINLRHPGVLVLSVGNGVAGYDEAVIEAIKQGVESAGRKNRGIMAVALVALRLQALADPHSVRLGYVFFPVGNRHYRGESPFRMAPA